MAVASIPQGLKPPFCCMKERPEPKGSGSLEAKANAKADSLREWQKEKQRQRPRAPLRAIPGKRDFYAETAVVMPASASSQSTSLAKGSKPMTRGPSATKLDSALMS